MSQGFFEQVLFYGISESKVYTGSLSLLSEKRNKIPIDFAFSEKDILAKITPKTLFVLGDFHSENLKNRLGQLLYELGFPLVISFRFWEEKSRELLDFFPLFKENQNSVVLAYFTKSEQNLFYSLFSLYGFLVETVNSQKEFLEKVNPKDTLILLNLDFLNNNKEIYSTLRSYYQKNPQLAICAMKDFSNFSFLSDLQSPLKEFCRTIFSKDEMFLFFRDYLQVYFYSELVTKMSQKLASLSPGFTIPLRNIPPLVEKLGTFTNNKKEKQSQIFLENLSKLVLCHELTEGFSQFLQKSEIHEKATFHFIEKDPWFSRTLHQQNFTLSEFDRAVQ